MKDQPLEGERLENFERAFSNGTSTCRALCDCGRIYYCDADKGCFDEGELEELVNNIDAFAVDYSIGYMGFEGREFANACTCWHQRATKIAAWIDGHGRKVAEWLSLEKARKVREANSAPTVE